MENKKKSATFVVFLHIFLILSISAQSDELVIPRIQPLPYIQELSRETLPLSPDTAISAALLLSNISDPLLEQKKDEIGILITSMKQYIKNKKTGKEKAEGVLLFLHDQVFKKYSEFQTRVDIVLEKGTYNCVSSAVLYMLLIKAIGLDVWGIKTKDHAFCRVDTGDGEFDVETTNIYGFDPGSKKEFTDRFGNQTGYSYVPPGNYSKRTDISDLELISLILQNRITYLNNKDNYYSALELAIDLYGLMNDENTFNILVALTGNIALWFTSRKEYEQGIEFYDRLLSRFRENEQIENLRYKIVHNYVLHLLNKKALDKAEQFVTERNTSGLLKEDEYKEYMIYIILDKANKLSETSYKDAIELLDQSIKTYGNDERLLKIKNGLINNWIIMYINKEDWDQVEELANTFIENGEITKEQWVKYMSMVFNGRVFIIAEEKGNLEAALYIKKALEIIENDKILTANYKNYLYNYTVGIHNKAVRLIKEKEYEQALELINEGLKHVPDSSLLNKDLKKLRKEMDG